MNKIFETHFDEIFQLFKDNFNKELVKTIDLNFLTIMDTTLKELSIIHYQEKDIKAFQVWFENIYNLHFLKEYIENADYDEIIIHNHQSIQIKSRFESKFIKTRFAPEDLQQALEILGRKNNIEWNYAEPFSSFTAKLHGQKFRMTLTHFSITPNKMSKLFLRKITHQDYKLEEFKSSQALSHLLMKMLNDKSNLLIAGSTGSGKTAFLKALLNLLPELEHLIILEDTHEINLERENVTNLLANQKIEGKTLTDYCSYSMRMSPDRLIVGELRSHEVVPFLLSMNSGHKGLMSTIHANSALDTVSRLNLLFSIYSKQVDLSSQFVTNLVCKNIDYIIYLQDKEVIEVVQLLGSEGMTPYFENVYLKAG